jgi:hypothetical protein
MGLGKASGEFFRELLDTPGRITTASTVIIALGGGTLVAAIGQAFLNIHGLFLLTLGLLVFGLVVMLGARYVAQNPQEPSSTTAAVAVQELATQPGVSSHQAINFDFDNYFRLGHVSQLTEQTQRDITNAVTQQHPNDREATLAKFIGIGFWGYLHEITWAYIYRSQIAALTELNANGGLLPIASIRAHFDKAAVEYPTTYAHYSFQQWMNFLETQQGLFVRHPSDMIEITLRGRDFLKFMTHWGWNDAMRKN